MDAFRTHRGGRRHGAHRRNPRPAMTSETGRPFRTDTRRSPEKMLTTAIRVFAEGGQASEPARLPLPQSSGPRVPDRRRPPRRGAAAVRVADHQPTRLWARPVRRPGRHTGIRCARAHPRPSDHQAAIGQRVSST